MVLFSFAAASAATIPVDLNKIITSILVPDANGNPVRSGAGFFVVVKDPSKPDNAFGYLVTAKHLLRDPNGRRYDHIFVRLNKIKGGSDIVRIDLQADGKSSLFTLPDPAVDIAVIPALPNTAVYDFRAVPEDMIEPPKEYSRMEMGSGSDVFFVGPLQSYDATVLIPVARFGHIALIPGRPLAWRPDRATPLQPTRLLLIEGQSFAGNAGSPVFLMPNPDDAIENFITQSPAYKLLGVTVGDYNAAGVASPAEANPGPAGAFNTNIEAVAPGFLLYQIIYSNDLKKMRGGAVEQAKK